MTTAAPIERESKTGSARIERRDLSTRVLRDALATWFSLHPATLASIDEGTVERMALRLEGRRTHRLLDASDVCR
ncbi:MAG: hypothetical protein ACREEC_13650, partial [Thermoplasmata archaeon]